MAAPETEKPLGAVGEQKVAMADHVSTAEDPVLNNPTAAEVNVRSVGLTDALAKDQPNYKSKSQIQLYAFMVFTTLSTYMLGLVWGGGKALHGC